MNRKNKANMNFNKINYSSCVGDKLHNVLIPK